MVNYSDSLKLDAVSLDARKKILNIVECNRRGHIGSAFSVVEILRVLYGGILRVKPGKIKWDDRDRFILSKGHGCLALYAVLAEKGFFPENELWRMSEKGSILGGHPDCDKVPGVEASTGSLGHGLPIGLGIALNARLEKKDYRTFVLMGDGECGEGSVWEAALTAGKYKLNNLFVLVDYNKMQCYSSTYEVQNLEPFADKWRSFGFNVEEVDGHDVEKLGVVLRRVTSSKTGPTTIICHTTKGKGICSLENTGVGHHKSKISDAEMQKLYTELEKNR